MIRKSAIAAALLAGSTLPAFAHLDPVEHGSFMAGFSHPFFGTDHILAMLVVGLWASLLATRKALWLVPAAFVGTMFAGFLAAMAGAPLFFVEPVILASVIVIGLLAAVALSVPVPAAMAMVGFSAFFHGYAHGGEIGAAGATIYALGFSLATAILHAAGIAFGIWLGRAFGANSGRTVARIAGGLAATGGILLALGA